MIGLARLILPTPLRGKNEAPAHFTECKAESQRSEVTRGGLSVNPTQSGLALSPRNLAPPHVTPHILTTTFQKGWCERRDSPTCVCKCDCVGGQWGEAVNRETTQRRRPWLRVSQKSPLSGQAGARGEPGLIPSGGGGGEHAVSPGSTLSPHSCGHPVRISHVQGQGLPWGVRRATRSHPRGPCFPS